MKKIGILTRDCAGINAALRAAVRTAASCGLEVMGVLRGYEGLIDGTFSPLDRRSVSGIINLGGTILKTARSERFLTVEGRETARRMIERYGLDGLLTIGGNGTFKGAHVLAAECGLGIVGVPATIDNDINGVETAIGADTAVNVAMEALDKIRDTATSLERIFVVEVMGRQCGSIAMNVALAGGCEEVLLPEMNFSIESVCAEITAARGQGKASWIIILAEGCGRAAEVAEDITRRTGLETRIAVLGHIQRGGRPTAADRILAARLGHFAVLALLRGETDICVRLRDGCLETLPLGIAVKPKMLDMTEDYSLLKVLS